MADPEELSFTENPWMNLWLSIGIRPQTLKAPVLNHSILTQTTF
jgi:hypothetical protein